MKISVVVPVFDGAKTIGRCLESIALQAEVKPEVIVIDGGSSDETVSIVEKYGHLVKVLQSEPDRGQSHAINKGLELATGDILCWLCCDDEFTPNALAKIVQKFGEDKKVDVVSGACRRLFPDGKTDLRAVSPDSWKRVGYHNEFDQPGMFWSRRAFEQAGGVDESFHLAMDWDYWNRLKSVMRQYRIADEILANYHFSHHNKTSNDPAAHLAETRRIVASYGPYDGQTERLYSHLYTRYDLNGCYDSDRKPRRALRKEHHAYLSFAETIFDEDVVRMYNWNWISRMARGLS